MKTARIRKASSLILLSLSCDIHSLEETKYRSIEKVRELIAPNPISTKNGEMEESSFWDTHGDLIRQAWNEWEEHLLPSQISSNDEAWDGKLSTIMNETLLEAINSAHVNPWEEKELKGLWKEVAPDVYATQLLQPEKIHIIREHLNSVSKSGIPTRRPNGMNRYGYILEPSINGSVLLSPLNNFYNNLAAHVLRPIGRTLFPDYYSTRDNNDGESYAFTIRYKENEDVSLNEHSDSSLVTLNINLNLPGEESSYGSNESNPQIYFVDEQRRYNVSFTPGMALLHRGMKRHAAYPIQSGERTNLIVWLFGLDGYVRVKPYEDNEKMDIFDRWSLFSKGSLEEKLEF